MTNGKSLLSRGLRGVFGAAPGLNLADGIDYRVEGEQGRGVARLVVAHRLEHGDVGPLAVARRLAVLLEHLAYGLPQRAQLVRIRAHDMMRHDRGRRLA